MRKPFDEEREFYLSAESRGDPGRETRAIGRWTIIGGMFWLLVAIGIAYWRK